MKSRKGFTLIELMVVILIVGILAAVAIPLMRGRIDSAKWSEGKSSMGSIATCLRAHVAEKGSLYSGTPTLAELGMATNDLDGTYFTGGESGVGNFTWVITDDDPITFLVTATKGLTITTPQTVSLDQDGQWLETP
jgi:prepilin-type N-terminal cleavage/methylation domain-containing protein